MSVFLCYEPGTGNVRTQTERRYYINEYFIHTNSSMQIKVKKLFM